VHGFQVGRRNGLPPADGFLKRPVGGGAHRRRQAGFTPRIAGKTRQHFHQRLKLFLQLGGLELPHRPGRFLFQPYFFSHQVFPQQQQLGKLRQPLLNEQALNMNVAQLSQPLETAFQRPVGILHGRCLKYPLQEHQFRNQAPRGYPKFVHRLFGKHLLASSQFLPIAPPPPPQGAGQVRG
jgi:hypothetical protein